MKVVNIIKAEDIGKRLRQLRKRRRMSYSDIERATSSVWLNSHSHIGGLDRAYLSRIENGHARPTLPPLERWAKALRLELWQIFCDVDEDAPEMNTNTADIKEPETIEQP